MKKDKINPLIFEIYENKEGQLKMDGTLNFGLFTSTLSLYLIPL